MSRFVRDASNILKGDLVSALIINEDGIGLEHTVSHLKSLGFRNILVASNADTDASLDLDVPQIQMPDGPRHKALSELIQNMKGHWLHICFNSEFLAFPFSETRSIQDFCGFLVEERRKAAHVTVIDHYADDLSKSDYGYSQEDIFFDIGGYYARHSETTEDPIEPIVEIFGGLRWRYEEEFPQDRRRCNRASLFLCQSDAELTADLRFKDDHMNSLQCPWHHSPTAALRSFRAAKYLMINPGSRANIENFKWDGSKLCDWTSSQLLDLGFIEPGQWF